MAGRVATNRRVRDEVERPLIPKVQEDQTEEKQSPSLSFLIPTRHESENIRPLLDRLARSLKATEAEVIFIDDSDDDTPRTIAEASNDYSIPVRLIHRSGPERVGGLGGAVIAGMRAARGPWLCVMDADLQHPPELALRLYAEATEKDVDVVLASRYCQGGSPTGLGGFRTLISSSLVKLAQFIFPRQLRGITDPLSGFFIVRKDSIDIEKLRPQGFKILLEILIRSTQLRVMEVPFQIEARQYGESKASAQELQRYVLLLVRLRVEHIPAFARFGMVGLSGLVVNTVAITFFTEILSFHYLLSAIVATQFSSLWNFSLIERWVFQDRTTRRASAYRLTSFLLVNNFALLVRGPALVILASGLGLNYLIANVLTIVGFMLVRFALADLWIWNDPPKLGALTQHVYDIHGIIGVSSDTKLPELQAFEVAKLSRRPDIVSVCQARCDEELADPNDLDSEQLHYKELLGGLGFEVFIERSERRGVRVAATPALCRSPHVLYTNVIEPILRWSFAERGYALVHAACVSGHEEAILITARTDTGKTTTILKVLDNYPLAFLSDDLILITSEGKVLNYPKPLTISRHTLHAVKTPLLSLTERMALFVQSRVHSRGGRKLAYFLVKTGLPVATINMMAQWLIPPPKYDIRRLVPSVRIHEEAMISDLVVIERGSLGETVLSKEAALEILLSNTEDAFGFPPYQAIESFLRHRNGSDLHDIEAAIVAQALGHAASTKIVQNSTYDWWRFLPIESLGQQRVTASLEQ